MTIRRLFSLAALMLTIGLLSAVPLSAQTVLHNTTFASAVSSTATVVNVTAATGMGVGDLIVVPGILPEVMNVIAINGTAITVTRLGTVRPHRSGVTLFYDPPNYFYNNPPDISSSCTRSTLLYQPWVDVRSGISWSCNGEGTNTTGTWFGGWTDVVAYNSTPVR